MNTHDQPHLTAVAPLESIPLSSEDRDMVLAACTEIVDAQTELGAEYERHMHEATRLKERIDVARMEYRALVDVLAKKLVKQKPGSYDFRPEIGAFVRTPSNR